MKNNQKNTQKEVKMSDLTELKEELQEEIKKTNLTIKKLKIYTATAVSILGLSGIGYALFHSPHKECCKCAPILDEMNNDLLDLGKKLHNLGVTVDENDESLRNELSEVKEDQKDHELKVDQTLNEMQNQINDTKEGSSISEEQDPKAKEESSGKDKTNSFTNKSNNTNKVPTQTNPPKTSGTTNNGNDNNQSADATQTPPPEQTKEPSVKPTDPPAQTTEPSVKPTDPPVKPTDPPVKPTDPPVKPTDPPVKPTDPPVKPTDPPIEPTDPPVKPTDPPVQPTDPPVKPTDPPVQPTDPPVQPSDPTPTPDHIGDITIDGEGGSGIGGDNEDFDFGDPEESADEIENMIFKEEAPEPTESMTLDGLLEPTEEHIISSIHSQIEQLQVMKTILVNQLYFSTQEYQISDSKTSMKI